MRAAFEVFRASSWTSWEDMLTGVADFSTDLGPERLITISQSEDRGGAAVTVWYWEAENGEETQDKIRRNAGPLG